MRDVKSETGEITVGVVLHGKTREEREVIARELVRQIMELAEDGRLMKGVKGAQIKRGQYKRHTE